MLSGGSSSAGAEARLLELTELARKKLKEEHDDKKTARQRHVEVTATLPRQPYAMPRAKVPPTWWAHHTGQSSHQPHAAARSIWHRRAITDPEKL